MNPHRHHPSECRTTTCRYCDPDAELWALGELVVAPLRLLWWLVCHPVVSLPLIVGGLIAAAVYGVL